MEFTNRRYFLIQTFELGTSALKVKRKSLFESIEYDIKYLNIKNGKIVQTIFNTNAFVLGCFFLVFCFLCFIFGGDMGFIFGGLISLVFFSVSVSSRKRVITIPTSTGDDIQLFFNKRNRIMVEEWADEIIQASNRYYFDRYSKVDKDLPKEPQIQNLQILLNRGILSQELYLQMKDSLLGRENRKEIGFN